MITHILLALLPLPNLSGAVDTVSAARVYAEDPAPVADKRPEVEEAVDAFKAHTDKKGSEDREAIEIIDKKLIPEFKKSGPKDKDLIVKGLAKVFDLRRNDEKEGVPNNGLFIAAATALGEMGPESTKLLVSAIDNKNLKKQMSVRSTLIRSLGKTRDVKGALDPLIKLLQDKDAVLVAAAGEALGEFADADLAARKKGFEAMLKVVNAAKDSKDSDVNDTTARERYEAIATALVSSLGKLAKLDERDPDKLRDWWNKNKNKNWDE
ncbi:MAG: HEAT repeat domain-containing protein [Planctomycetes bacterium]|nr:HEAT repeat domain-containing protein [Planctomycetota bacterium]